MLNIDTKMKNNLEDKLKKSQVLAQKIVKVVYAENNYYDAYEKVQEIIKKELNT